jgi:acyl-CoA thioester hydrolase
VPADPTTDGGPFVWTGTVLPEWTDHNGHMNVAYYLMAFDVAGDAMNEAIGIDDAYRAAGLSTFAVEHHICYLREIRAGAALRCETRIVDHDEKRMHVYAEMTNATEGYLAATCEMMALHVDLGARRTVPFPAAVRDKIARLQAAHTHLKPPGTLGRSIGIRRKT